MRRIAGPWCRMLRFGGDGREGGAARGLIGGAPRQQTAWAWVMGAEHGGWQWGAGVEYGKAATRESAKMCADESLRRQGFLLVDILGGCEIQKESDGDAQARPPRAG